ncbi:ComEC/Rec2 family competence protein [Paenarthrobacter sp. UW852]|uniref:ComEC/Rec2 family competence protein n=1 Tax=Paenarthrobacter sp. UW852 TaxID=2951989 RepID=UPI0021487B03|nr:ComEC/Rec2 family competence protein [Paenarthrobacter sp. UW852]MCR1160014.1 ComEC/Rec2 family competence protein [Paenarthrobacter sp. UW852]
MAATFALACVVGAAVAVHCAVSEAKQEHGPLAPAVESGDGVVAHLVITGSPSKIPAPGQSARDRWTVDARLIDATYSGARVRGETDLVVVGDDRWQNVRAGDRVRTTGSLKEVRTGQPEAGLLSAASAPVAVGADFDVRGVAGDLRKHFVEATAWLPPDAAGLLPGMVTGDTSALPESLGVDMKTTGMTHLTAVSGANCSLVLGGFILLARYFRLSRPLSAAGGCLGLFAFVVLVGPDPSVLRAAVMGCVGVTALAGGLRGRALTFLCVASSVLLFVDPSLAGNVGFLLSVLATLGIVLLASRISSWFPPQVPRWLATAVAVPLAAQLLCGPVIAALQPQFTPYALVANVTAGPLVAPVTILGTIAVPLAAFVPWVAAAPLAIAGYCAGAIAALARFFAGLPGAALPWAEGPAGVVAMAVFSVVTVLSAWMMLHPTTLQGSVIALHSEIVTLLEAMASRRWREAKPPTCGHSSGRCVLIHRLIVSWARGAQRMDAATATGLQQRGPIKPWSAMTRLVHWMIRVRTRGRYGGNSSSGERGTRRSRSG